MSTPITVLYGGHRKVLRVGANENMSMVVQMACQEFGLTNIGSFTIMHKKQTVDLSQPFRFTGIPQNATLELMEEARETAAGSAAARKVRVAMRLPGGRRVQASFSPDATLCDLLIFWGNAGDLPADILDQGPKLQFMRTSYGGGDLSSSLRSVGLVG
ncbi:unnamed protein product [Choristocarpus tenellus]